MQREMNKTQIQGIGFAFFAVIHFFVIPSNDQMGARKLFAAIYGYWSSGDCGGFGDVFFENCGRETYSARTLS